MEHSCYFCRESEGARSNKLELSDTGMLLLLLCMWWRILTRLPHIISKCNSWKTEICLGTRLCKLTCMLAPGPGAPIKIHDKSKWLSPGGIKYGASMCLWSSSPIFGSKVLLQKKKNYYSEASLVIKFGPTDVSVSLLFPSYSSICFPIHYYRETIQLQWLLLLLLQQAAAAQFWRPLPHKEQLLGYIYIY